MLNSESGGRELQTQARNDRIRYVTSVFLEPVVTDDVTLSGDDSISGFQFRYDIDTILTKYRDVDKMSVNSDQT